jgi:hypothetical protein
MYGKSSSVEKMTVFKGNTCPKKCGLCRPAAGGKPLRRKPGLPKNTVQLIWHNSKSIASRRSGPPEV